MALLDLLVSDVSVITARPDLVATGDISVAIRRATLKAHSMAAWPRDVAEDVIQFTDITQRAQTISVPISLERFRSIKYIREYVVDANPWNMPVNCYFDKQEADSINDDYGQIINNIWYLGGNNINLWGRKAIPSVSVGWYQYPVVSYPIAYDSWIAEAYPFIITDEAARMIFKSTGNLDMAASFDTVMAEHRQYMIQNFIDGEGR